MRGQNKNSKVIWYDRGGGHELFYDLGYWWEDLRTFLREQLASSGARWHGLKSGVTVGSGNIIAFLRLTDDVALVRRRRGCAAMPPPPDSALRWPACTVGRLL